MTNNVSAVRDDAFNFSMWVEVYNSGANILNQNNFYFTDDLTVPKKWQPQSANIPSGGFRILYFERDDRPGHANFKLNPEGGVLYLLNSSGTLIDFVNYPPQFRNISYGRKTNGVGDWAYFEDYSPAASNANKKWFTQRCANPVFSIPGGRYASAINLRFEDPLPGDTIYYLVGVEEPTKASYIRYVPGKTISLNNQVAIVRAKCMSAGKLSSDVVTSTFLINQRKYNLPIVSIVSSYKFLYGDSLGIYTRGVNGIPGNGTDQPANWNQDWDRPANFELYDTTNVNRINQELDITIAGGWTRTMNGQKSLHISPKKKYGNNDLKYDFFKASKPGMKYHDIMFRNSGNDFNYSMLRDGFMQSLVANRMNIDYIAYEPAVSFLNGIYMGIQNIRERTGKDYLYSNYGLEEEDVDIIDQISMDTNDRRFVELTGYLQSHDMKLDANYQQVCKMMDVENYIDYMLAQIYFGNYDWPHNNIKMWRKKTDGKWRWILFDTDFGFSLYDTNLHNANSLARALGDNGTQWPWSTLIFSKMVQNPTFLNRFIDRSSIHLSTTFDKTRTALMLDSLAAKIRTEIPYHKAKWGSAREFNSDLNLMKNFANIRNSNLYNFIGTRFLNVTATAFIQMSSNLNQASYYMNGEYIQDVNARFKSYINRNLNFEAAPLKGYEFKYWEVAGGTQSDTIIPMGSIWKYFDGNGTPATNWQSADYVDSGWSSGQAQLGYGNKGEVTTIGYGGNTNNKYITAYFRKTVNISDLDNKNNFKVEVFADDAAAVYFNGTEIGRVNLPAGDLSFTTLSTTYNNGVSATFDVPTVLIKDGNNLLAIEVHQTAANSSDLIFNANLICSKKINTTEKTTQYAAKLTGDISLKAVYAENNQPNPILTATVLINEVVSGNSMIGDELNEPEDFVELYNHGDDTIQVAGWYLSDTSANRKLASIGTSVTDSTKIAPGGFLGLWADGQPEQGNLHLDFKISKDGENIFLSLDDKFGKLHTIDSVSVPALLTDQSFSRVPDGSADWRIQRMTFKESNILTATNNRNEKVIRAYTSPSTDFVFLFADENKYYQLIDLTGHLVLSGTTTSDREQIDIQSLETGIYILQAEGYTFKIIKK